MTSPGTPSGIIRFGPFELDPANRELRKRGNVIKLRPQQVAVLLLLVERAGQIVSREEIHQHVWDSDTFVDFDRGINFAINQIRAALGDAAEKPRFVETIPRRGYRFLCPVEVSEAAPIQPETNAGPTGGPVVQASAPFETPATGEVQGKSDHPSTGPRWKSRKWLLPGLVFALLLILAARFLGGKYKGLSLHRPSLAKAKTAPGRERTVALTNVRGLVQSPIFSPDGKQIAFLWNGKDQNKMDLYVQMIGGEQPLRLTYSGIRNICCLDWSPDGQWISFARWDGDVGGVFTHSGPGWP
jgi:DNA-binding winged helix-turn-helix (wHTH) protein